MTLAGGSLDSVEARYRALVDVASALSSHSELTYLLRILRGHLEPLLSFSLHVVCHRDRHPAVRARRLERRNVAAARQEHVLPLLQDVRRHTARAVRLTLCILLS